MKVKLQPPSSTELPAFNPILPPSTITQILLLANPHKVLCHITPPPEFVMLQFLMTRKLVILFFIEDTETASKLSRHIIMYKMNCSMSSVHVLYIYKLLMTFINEAAAENHSNWTYFFPSCFRKKCVCGTRLHSTLGTNLSMNPVMWTSSHLQTPGGTFSVKETPSCHLICCFLFRFRLKLSLIAGWGNTSSVHFSGFKLWFDNTNWREASSGKQLLPCAFLSFIQSSPCSCVS